MTYAIETRNPNETGALADWHSAGDDNSFATQEEAEAAIVTLKTLGPDWAEAEYRIVKDR